MMYFGGKVRVSDKLAEFLNSELEPDQTFVDLFCGSCNVVSKINPDCKRIANDKHFYLIEMWKSLQNGWVPPENVSSEYYKEVKSNLDENPALSSFIGFGCSFAGKWWGGYARGGEGRNYAKNAKNSTMKKVQNLTDVVFFNKNYDEVLIPKNSLVYCDIPYKNSTSYSVGEFDHQKFYAWCKEMEGYGISVYVSEYAKNTPCEAAVVWSQKSRKDIRNSKGELEPTEEVIFRFLEKGNG